MDEIIKEFLDDVSEAAQATTRGAARTLIAAQELARLRPIWNREPRFHP